jgi:hypothetical protein
MRVRVVDQVLYIHAADVPRYKKKGSVVRNTLFWALQSIAVRAVRDREWEYDAEVWVALVRMLEHFTASGYLGLSETQLQFDTDADIPPILKPVSTWVCFADYEEDDDLDNNGFADDP